MDFGTLRVTYLGNAKPVVDAASVVDRINRQTAKNAEAQDRVVARSKKVLADVQTREAKRGADAFIRELERTRRASHSSSGSGSGGGVGSELSALTGGRLAFAGGGAAVGIGALAAGFGAAASAGIKFDATIDQLSRSFTTLLGSQVAAQEHLKELQDFANRTPFEFEDVARASQKFLNMGVAAKDVIPILTSVGNAVARTGGGSQQVEAVSRAIAQVGARGKVSAEEMNQLADALVDGWGPLEVELGKTRGELMKMAEQGQISAETFITAFRKAHESGRGMADQMNTLTGSTSTLTDAGRQLLGYAFLPMHDALRGVTVELARLTTEGWNSEKVFKAMASSARDFINVSNSPWFDKWLILLGAQAGGVSGGNAMATILGYGKGEERRRVSEINIPQEFQYKQKISDADLAKTQGAAARQAKDAYVADILRKQEEAQQKARQETERQADVLKRISGDYAEASTRVSGYAGASLQLEAALYKLSIGYNTLSDANKKLAQDEINNLYAAKSELALKEITADLRAKLTASVKEYTIALGGEQTEVEKVNESYREWQAEVFKTTGRTAQLHDELNKLLTRALGFAGVVDNLNAMKKAIEENRAAAANFNSADLLKPSPVTGYGAEGPQLKPLDLTRVGVDDWKTFRESWNESLQYMRQDGIDIFADMFARIGEGWRSAAGGLVLDFARALNQMASQAAASVVWGAILRLAGGVLGGAFAGNLPLGGGAATPGGLGAGLTPGSVTGFASGTPSAPSGLAWVGEHGPELVNFRGGERVFNNADSRRMGGTVINKTTIINYQPRMTPDSYTSRRSGREAFEGFLSLVK